MKVEETDKNNYKIPQKEEFSPLGEALEEENPDNIEQQEEGEVNG